MCSSIASGEMSCKNGRRVEIISTVVNSAPSGCSLSSLTFDLEISQDICRHLVWEGVNLMDTITITILNDLKKAGHKFTGKRQEIVDLFVRNGDRFLCAKDVYLVVKEMYPNVSYDTIYRTLALLEQHEVIEVMEFSSDSAKYRLACRKEHHHHVICLQCGTTVALDQCPMENVMDAVDDFTIVNHRFEIYGYCVSCTKA